MTTLCCGRTICTLPQRECVGEPSHVYGLLKLKLSLIGIRETHVQAV